MTDIPKRPELPTDDWRMHHLEMCVHEHAVAVRLWDALIEISTAFNGNPNGYTQVASEMPNIADAALNDIEASGWKP